MRWRQDILDPYLLAKKTFRGVFYKPPKEDAIKVPKGRKGKGRKRVARPAGTK